MLVQLSRGAAHTLVQDTFSNIVGSLWLDPALVIGTAIGPLLAVCMDLLKRFDQYLAYPYKLSSLCERWHPNSYLTSIMEFIQESPLIWMQHAQAFCGALHSRSVAMTRWL